MKSLISAIRNEIFNTVTDFVLFKFPKPADFITRLIVLMSANPNNGANNYLQILFSIKLRKKAALEASQEQEIYGVRLR